MILPVSADVLPDWANTDDAHKIRNVTRTKREQSVFFDFTPTPFGLSVYGCALYNPRTP